MANFIENYQSQQESIYHLQEYISNIRPYISELENKCNEYELRHVKLMEEGNDLLEKFNFVLNKNTEFEMSQQKLFDKINTYEGEKNSLVIEFNEIVEQLREEHEINRNLQTKNKYIES